MSNIEWTDVTYNPVVGCTPVSPGCLNCYAATMANRIHGMTLAGRDVPGYGGRPLTRIKDGRQVFTGEVRLVRDRVTEPMKWKKPRMVFVNSMSDLFHESVRFEFIDRIFAVMALCPQHTFQVLTKRPERMAEYLNRRPGVGVAALASVLTSAASRGAQPITGDFAWPLPNVWLGTSVEDQARADERIPNLLRCPAAVRFLFCEPLLGPVDLSAYFGGEHVVLPGDRSERRYNFGIHWVIVGGESGPRARPCDVAWIESIVTQCREAGVPVFLKQMGTHVGITDPSGPAVRDWGETRVFKADDGVRLLLRDRKGGDPAEWPERLRVREWPIAAAAEGGAA